jgi:hypothetical protein
MISIAAGRLHHHLFNHMGKDAGVKARVLAQTLCMTPRRLRLLVSELREEGVAICGHPGTGYYIALSAEELEESCKFLHARALHSLHLESRLRKIPLPELVGQLRLETEA